MSEEKKAPEPEVIYGAKNIAKRTGRKPATIFHHLNSGHVAGAQKVAGQWALSVPVWRKAMHGEG